MTHKGDQQVAPTGHNVLCPYIGEAMPFDSPSARLRTGIRANGLLPLTLISPARGERIQALIPLYPPLRKGEF